MCRLCATDRKIASRYEGRYNQDSILGKFIATVRDYTDEEPCAHCRDRFRKNVSKRSKNSINRESMVDEYIFYQLIKSYYLDYVSDRQKKETYRYILSNKNHRWIDNKYRSPLKQVSEGIYYNIKSETYQARVSATRYEKFSHYMFGYKTKEEAVVARDELIWNRKKENTKRNAK